MAQSGIKCDETVLENYQKLSTGSNKPYRYIIFKIQQDEKGEYTKVTVDKTGDRDKTFQDMKADLNEDECRYIVYDVSYRTKGEGQYREKIIFIKFVPQNADRKAKMVYSSTEKELKAKIGTATLSASFHYDFHNEIDENEITESLAKKG